jgi:hypothetical protein
MNAKQIGTLKQLAVGILEDVAEVVATGRLSQSEAAAVEWAAEEWGLWMPWGCE